MEKILILMNIVGLLFQSESSAEEISINPNVTEPKFLVQNEKNMQGLGFYENYYYIGFDIGDNHGIIEKYSLDGKLIKSTKSLPIGHTAELDFRDKNGHLYVANGGGKNPTKIYEVDFEQEKVINTLDLSNLGNSALLAIDNKRDYLIVHTAANDQGDPKFSTIDFDGNIINQFTFPNQGVPQGLEFYNDKIYYYTNDKITVLNTDGESVQTFEFNFEGESQGMTVVDTKNPYITIAYKGKNRLYELK